MRPRRVVRFDPRIQGRRRRRRGGGIPVRLAGRSAAGRADDRDHAVSRVPDDVIWTALELELAEGTVVADAAAEPCVFLGALYRGDRPSPAAPADGGWQAPWPGIDVDRGAGLGGEKDRPVAGAGAAPRGKDGLILK